MITFVTHLRYDHPDRLQNLNAIIDYYANGIDGAKFIFVEDDVAHNPAFKSVNFIKGATKFVFVENPHTYYRTRALNIGMKMADTDVVVSLDTDCLVPLDSIKECAEMLTKGKVAAWPYNGYFVDVLNPLRDQILRKRVDYRNILSKMDGNIKMPLMVGYKCFQVRCTDSDHLGTGGIVMFNREKFLQVGGYNQKFIGWGCEDNEIVDRLRILGLETYRDTRPESICFHLFHQSAQRAENPFFDKNSEEWHKIKAMKKEDLEALIQTWEWV